MESATKPPDELTAARLFGTGKALLESIEKLPYTAVWAVPIRAKAHGIVSGSLSAPKVKFRFTPEDERTLGLGQQEIGTEACKRWKGATQDL